MTWGVGGEFLYFLLLSNRKKNVSIGRHCSWELAKEEEKNNSEDTSGKGFDCFVRKVLAFIPCL